MILLLLVAVWFLILLAVASLCTAARAGDRQRLIDQPVPQAWELPQPAILPARPTEDQLAA